MILCGEALAVLRTMDADSVDSCVTSPPYWRMRDYGHAEQLGMEADVDAFVDRLADIFDEVRRVLKPTGSAWVNLGDAYARRGGGRNFESGCGRRYIGTPGRASAGLKAGDLAGVPWRFAFECQRRGWWLRSEVVWNKPNATPTSCKSRPSSSHEHLFMLTKVASPGYYYDVDSLRTPLRDTTRARTRLPSHRGWKPTPGLGAQRGDVWTIGVCSNRGAIGHFAMQSPEIARLCILASTPPGGVVLDPFVGSGTTAIVASRLGRACIGIELVPETADLARRRTRDDAPLFAEELRST